MNDPRTVVVGVDGSAPARGALRWALAEAQLWGTPLEVIHAGHAPSTDLIDRELDAIGPRVPDSVEILRTPVRGFAARALVEASRHAQLVVVGRHGLGGFPRELIGPKAVQVAHHAASPVAVVPDRWSRGARGVVVGVDGSTHARHALKWAHEEAQRRNAPLHAVLAWGLLDQHHIESDTPFDPRYGADDARAVLEQCIDAALGDERADVTPIVVNDLAARALIQTAATGELLVVGARGLGGFGDLLLGSVSHRCLSHARCPTVVVR